jgi:ubiquinone/menaquinone biosynthesis C-methylase UbiE
MLGGWRRLNSLVCPRWFVGSFDNRFRSRVHDPVAILGPRVRAGDTVADVGCGIGYFTVPLARLVGPSGRVTAIDLQQSMLDGAARRVEGAGLLDRVSFHRASVGQMGASGPFDFILAFWMVHEVPAKGPFMREIRRMLAPGGSFLMVEPVLHVSGMAFYNAVEDAIAAGLSPAEAPTVRLSRAVLFGVSTGTTS